MKKFFTILTMLIVLVSGISQQAQGQCTNTSQYGSATAPTSGTVTFSTCSYRSEYSPLSNVVSGTIYQCAISGGGFVTIRRGTYNGPVVAYGNSPLQWTATTGGTHYCHWNTNSSCGLEYNNCVTTTCTYMGFLPGENCTNPQNLATLTSPYSSTTVGYANDIGVCRTGYPDRIFYINVPNGYTVDIWQSANEYDSYHYMGYGGSCPGSTTLYCIDDPDTQHNPWTNTTGSTQTVYFVVDAYIGSGTFTLQWTLIDRTVTSATSGNWSASSTWVGGMVPTLNDNVVVSAGHAVIADVVVERNNGRTTTVNTGGSLTTANGMAFYNYGSVTVSPGASLAIGDNYINGTTTINGICQINPGGYFTGSPTYGPSSTLVYNTGSTYNRGDEWTSTGGAGYPNNVTINSGSSLNLGYGGTGTARQMAGNLTLDGGLYMDYDSYDMTEKLNVLGNVVINTTGVLSLSNANLGDLHVKGNWTRNGSGTFNPNDRAVYFNGTGVQTITGATTFDYLRLFKTTGNVVLASDITVTRPLEINLSGGLVNTGSNKVIIASTGSVVRTNGWINGNLQKNIPTGTATHTFEIGDATVYAPVNLAFNNVTTAGDILASTVKPGSAPPVVSNISQINYLNRKWTITNAGTVFDNYNATFNFVAGDLTGGANTANFIVGKNDGGTWTNPTMGTKTATTTQITGVTSFSEFWMGESTYFITTWKTDNPGSDPDKVDFPGVGDNYSIYWEDASNPAINGTLTGNGITTITFPAAGTYKVNVTPGAGTFNRFNMNDGTDKQKLLDVNQWGTIEWTSMETAFYGCSNLNITATDLPVLSSVSSMSSMFSGCSVLNGPANITNWNTSAVTTMNSMFSGASAFNQNIGSWTFNSTVNLTNMLDNCGMDCSIYSATLTGWYANPSTPNGLSLGADGRQYNCSAYAARTILTGVKGWSINGDSPCEAGPTATLENTGDAPCLGFALLDVIGDPDIVSIDYYNGSTLVHSAVRLPATEGSTVAGGNGGGSNASQLYYPTGVFVDGSGNIFIADHYNHRIQKWVPGATSGTTVAGGNGAGSNANQLHYPSGVFVDGSGNIFIADRENHRIQKWAPGAISGTTVAGGNGAGSNANQLDYTTGVFVDGSGYIFIADHYNHRIQKWAPGATSGTTVAGGNGPGSNANQLNYPFGVHVDGAGNIFIADRDNHRIQKWEPGATSGATVAGGNGAGSNANQLNYPYGFHVDGAGNIFIADQSNHRIQKWAPGATSGTTVAGGNGGGSNANQLRYPQGVHVDRTGNIFIADVNNHRIQKWDGTMVTNYTPVVGGTYIAVVTTSSGCSVATNEIVVYDLPLMDAGTYEPVSSNAQPVILGGEPIGGEWTGTGVSGNPSDGYIFDPSAGTQELTYTITDGNGCSNSDQAIICIIPVLENTGDTPCLGFALLDVIGDPDIVSIDFYNGSTLVHSAAHLPATEGSTVAGGNGAGSNANQLYYPYGVHVDGAGNIFIADYYNHRIQKWAPGATSGTTVAGGNGEGSNANQLAYPTGVFVDGSGNIFIADYANHRIQKWAPGAISGTTVAGGNGYGSNANQLAYPYDVFVDGSGNIFIADRNNHRIQKWAPGATSGATVAGGNGSGSAANQLAYPNGVFVDGSGNIFIADGDNHRIQKWEPGATSGTTVAGGNGSGSNANQLAYPYDVFVDGSGNIFIADNANHRIQKWAPGATSGTTFAGGNGAGSNANQLNYPFGVHVDGAGIIFIADRNNHRIQKWGGTMVTNYTPVVGGTYIAVVTTSSGCTVATNEIVVYDLPLVDAGTYEPVSSNAQPVILGGEPIGGEWTGTGVSGNPSDGYIFDPSAGTQELTYTITDGNGCSNSDQAIICIIPVLENTGDAPCLGFALLDVIGDPDIVSIDYYNGSTLVHSAVRLPATEGTTVAGGNGEGFNANQLYYPTGVFVDGSGNIFIADLSNHRIQKWAPGATSGTTVAGGNGAGSNANQLYYPSGVHVDGAGNIFIADRDNHRIQKWAPGATSGATVAGGNGYGSNANQLYSPQGVHVDGAGNIFIADRNNHRIQKWAPGATSGATVAGGNGSGSAANQLAYPIGVFVDGAGTIFIADQSNHRIQKWAPGATSGATVAGGNGYGSNANQLYYPTGVFVDGSGNIFIADRGNHRIQKWAPGATSGTTVAGGNGYGSNANQLYSPFGVHVDGSGNIFIADYSNHRIQKWGGTFITSYTPVVGGTYIAVVTTASGCTVVTNEIVITEFCCTNPTNGGEIAESQTICYGTLTVPFTGASVPTGYVGDLEYQWQISTASPTFADIPGVFSETYTHVGTVTQTTWFRRLAKVTCETDWVESNVVEITVDPLSEGGTVTNAQTICSDETPADLELTGHVGNVLRWQRSANAAFTSPVNISVTSTTLSGSTIGAVTQDTWFRAEVQSGVCDPAYSDAVKITIDTNPPYATPINNTVALNPSGTYTLAVNDLLSVYGDNENSVASITMTPSTFNCTKLGQTITVEVKVVDECNNETIVYSNITVQEGTGLPAPWLNANTHASANGTAIYSPCDDEGTFMLTATGKSTTTKDVHHFVHQQLCGNGTVIARLDEVQNGGWAGVMMRESNAHASKAILFKTRLYNPNVIIGYRTSTGSAMRNLSQVAQLIRWMKIQRSGSNFKVFTSYNGTTWQQRYSGTISMNSCIQAGIFTESVLASRTSVAWFDNVEVVPFLKAGDDFAGVDVIEMDKEQVQIDLYPNPADDQVTIFIAGNESEVSYQISDMEGRLIGQSTFTGSEFLLDVSNYKPGLYVIRFEIDGEIFTKRLVVM